MNEPHAIYVDIFKESLLTRVCVSLQHHKYLSLIFPYLTKNCLGQISGDLQ